MKTKSREVTNKLTALLTLFGGITFLGMVGIGIYGIIMANMPDEVGIWFYFINILSAVVGILFIVWGARRLMIIRKMKRSSS